MARDPGSRGMDGATLGGVSSLNRTMDQNLLSDFLYFISNLTLCSRWRSSEVTSSYLGEQSDKTTRDKPYLYRNLRYSLKVVRLLMIQSIFQVIPSLL